jgi:hypothetical protein
VGNESRLAESGLLVLGGRLVVLIRELSGVVAAVDAEEVLDSLRDLAVLAIDRLVGGQRLAREGTFLRHVGVARCGRVQELRHTGRTASMAEGSELLHDVS